MAGTKLMTSAFPIAKRQDGEPPSLADASQVAVMRSLTRTCLIDHGLDCILEDTALIVSELVTNAIQHSAGQEVTLTLDGLDGYLLIQVHDGMPKPPLAKSRPCNSQETGRGLWLVEAIANQRAGSWGASGDGSTTWCLLALSTVPEATIRILAETAPKSAVADK
ncbi:ATP-binding protein [Streptomyces sp. NPDC007205]|uniref:ATP-binding protein n=1 Tax=Streptomyces sp. NPDC007205 TaxID=3154316 RepID=UPI00340D88F7